MPHIVFKTARLTIARYTADDLDDFFAINSHPDVMRYIRTPKTFEECRDFLEENIRYYDEHPFMGRWKMLETATGIFVGSFAIIPVDGTAHTQLGYALLPEYWGRGYATESTRGGAAFAFENLPLEKIYGITEAPNTASQQVLLKCGFVHAEDYMDKDGKALKKFVLFKPVL